MSEPKKLSPNEMQAEIDRLRTELGLANEARTEAEELAASMAQASTMMGAVSEEHPTGNTIGIRVCTNPWERDEKEQKWKTIKYPTYMYAVQLPAGAGLCLATNGVEYYHGQAYEVDPFTLADLKSRVARCWEHEKSIHGDNENAYRKPTNRSFVSAAAAARGAR